MALGFPYVKISWFQVTFLGLNPGTTYIRCPNSWFCRFSCCGSRSFVRIDSWRLWCRWKNIMKQTDVIWFCFLFLEQDYIITHRIHVWYIYPHSPYKSTKCRQIYQSHRSYAMRYMYCFLRKISRPQPTLTPRVYLQRNPCKMSLIHLS